MKVREFFPGIPELLEHIKHSSNSFNALLTSNLRIGAETKLKSVGLEHYFHVGGFGDYFGEKWHAAEEGIKEAENYFKVCFSRENIYLIGDSAYDIECAKRLGIKSIGVATGFIDYDVLLSHKPDYIYEDLSNWDQLVFL